MDNAGVKALVQDWGEVTTYEAKVGAFYGHQAVMDFLRHHVEGEDDD